MSPTLADGRASLAVVRSSGAYSSSSSSSRRESPLSESLNSRIPWPIERPDLGQALRAEHDQGDDEHDDELAWADVEWHGLGFLSGAAVSTEGIGASAVPTGLRTIDGRADHGAMRAGPPGLAPEQRLVLGVAGHHRRHGADRCSAPRARRARPRQPSISVRS